MKQLFYLIFFLPGILPAFAQWDGNSLTVDNPVCNLGTLSLSVSDNYGGAIVALQQGSSIYMQRKTVGGQLNWGSVDSPVHIFTASTGTVQYGSLVADGEGGAYLSFIQQGSDSTAALYVQHIAGNGQLIFPAPGILINPPGVANCREGKLCQSGSSVFVVWANELLSLNDPRPRHSKLFLQKLSHTGSFLLDSAGVGICSAAGWQFFPVATSDSAGGLYVSFTDTRASIPDANGYYHNFDVYAQHFDSLGQQQWGSAGLAVDSSPFNQTTYIDYAPPFLRSSASQAADADGNLFIAYGHATADFYQDNSYLQVQKLSYAGTAAWPTATTLDSLRNNKAFLRLVPDGYGGIVASWKQISAFADMRAQRIDSLGQRRWGLHGVLASAPNDAEWTTSGNWMNTLSRGRYLFIWRTGDFAASFLKAQLLDTAGQKQWAATGVTICNNDGLNPRYPVANESIDSSVIIVWSDSRGTQSARLTADGTLKQIDDIGATAIAAGNWNNMAVWQTGLLPEPGADVLVTQDLVLDTDVICNSITVLSPATLTIPAGRRVVIFK